MRIPSLKSIFYINLTYGTRKKMLDIYDKIVKYTNSAKYNPPKSKIPEALKKEFLTGKSKLTNKDMPLYVKEKKS